jgi:glycosyltransferase involved in cell wall biosynthesis
LPAETRSTTISTVLIVVPAFNEQSNIADTLAEIAEAGLDADVLVVDDGSRDRTAQVARSCGADVLVLPFNLGVGGAMRAGFVYASRHDYRAVIQVDADGQHDPTEIPKLLAGLEDADLVIGSRFESDHHFEVTRVRRVAMRVLAWAVSGLTGTHLTDTTSGFRASGPAAIDLFAREYPAEYLGDTIESTVIAARAGLTIAQVPTHLRARRYGEPSQSILRATLYVGRAVIVLALAAIHRRPAEEGS